MQRRQIRRFRRRTACLVALLLVVVTGSSTAQTTEPVRSSGGVVASISEEAAAAAKVVLDRGGNAVDAAVAATYVVNVVRPDACGIGGGGFLVYRGADGTTAALDFRDPAPSDYTFVDGMDTPPTWPPGNPTTHWHAYGHQVVGVPGMVAGMEAARARFGTRPLAELIEPARDYAANGFIVGDQLSAAMAWHWYELGGLFPETRRTYLKDGVKPYKPHETMRIPDYAWSLDQIAKHGIDAFYGRDGAIAKLLVAEMKRSQSPTNPYKNDRGTITHEDLATYEAIWRQPLVTTYNGHEIITMPPPTSGGLALIEMLNILEALQLDRRERLSADHLHLMAEAEKIAWADRNAYVGDPDFVDVPIEMMTSKGYAAQRRGEIDIGTAKLYEPGTWGGSSPKSSGDSKNGHTAHVSVIDAAGNAVAVTCSIGQIFGSHVVAEGTGFLLNETLSGFDDPKDYPDSPNSPASLKRSRSSMTPAIVVRNGTPLLAVGAAGGTTIPMGVLNAIVNVVDFDLDVLAAIDAPRFDACGSAAISGAGFCAYVRFEGGRIPQATLDELKARGHNLRRTGDYAGPPFVNVAGTDLATGEHVAATDPRVGEWGSAGQ